MKSKLVSRRGYHLGCSVQAFEVENLVHNPVDAVFFFQFFIKRRRVWLCRMN